MRSLVLSVALAIVLMGCPNSKSSSPETTTDNRVHLSWEQPLSFEDETPLENSDIAAFYVYWGDSEDNLSHVEALAPTLREYDISGLSSGTYYFAVAVETMSGSRSLLSNIESKTFE